MLDILKWAVESVPNTLLLLVVLYMICPWCHNVRITKNYYHEFARRHKAVKKQGEKKPANEEQIRVDL